MKKSILILLLPIIFIFSQCSKVNFETGIKGQIIYGEGDCMPTIDYSSRKYDKYDGSISIIVKDEIGVGDFDLLRDNSITIDIKNGKLSTKLPEGIYLIMPEDVYLYSPENTITIIAGEVLEKDFKIWKCTSY